MTLTMEWVAELQRIAQSVTSKPFGPLEPEVVAELCAAWLREHERDPYEVDCCCGECW